MSTVVKKVGMVLIKGVNDVAYAEFIASQGKLERCNLWLQLN